jgi:hypothetical protein
MRLMTDENHIIDAARAYTLDEIVNAIPVWKGLGLDPEAMIRRLRSAYPRNIHG